MSGNNDDLELSFENVMFEDEVQNDSPSPDSETHSETAESPISGKEEEKNGERESSSEGNPEANKIKIEIDPIHGDIITTAIVIKNIPFSVKRDALLSSMLALELPKPYALNYHYDNGAFRGLAFANFKTPEETDQVIAAFNGHDIGGRKLKVEHKRTVMGGVENKKETDKLSVEKPTKKEKLKKGDKKSKSVPTSPMTDSSNLLELIEDPDTREIYNKIVSFRDDMSKEELTIFLSSTPVSKKIIHTLAQRLGMLHKSDVEGNQKCSKVYRKAAPIKTQVLRKQPIPIARSRLSPSPASKFSRSMGDLGQYSPSSRSPFRSSFKLPDGFPSVVPIRQPKGPDLDRNFANRSRKVIVSNLNPTFTLTPAENNT
ncbi:Peptidyl-prolyl cis-trans isomerase pin4, partial [Basidiobolus ranarum]